MGGLARRGHDVAMLVTKEGARQAGGSLPARDANGVRIEPALDYVLAAWRHPLRGLRAVAHDQRVAERALAAGVDAAVVWHMRGVMKTSLRLLHDAGVPVVYMLHDRWVLYERAGPWLAPWPRVDRLGFAAARELAGRVAPGRTELRAPPIAEEGIVCFVSRWLQEEYARLGWRPRHAHVVPCGVDVARIRALRARPPAAPPAELLYAGRIHPTKGLHVAVEALARTDPAFTLTVVGPEDDPRYLADCRARAERLGVDGRIDWRGEVGRSDVLDLLSRADVLVYPSIGVEAYSLGLIEALAAGPAIVTSAVGGPREYLEHERDALLFDPGGAAALARHLDRLRAEPELARELSARASATAEMLSLDAVLDQVESILADAVGSRLSPSTRR